MGSRDSTPFIISRSSTPSTATSRPMELSYSQQTFLDENGFAASAPPVDDPPIHYQSVQDFIRDTKF